MRLRTPLVWCGDRAVVDEDLAQHVWRTLGITPSVFHAWVDLCYPPGSVRRDILARRAFDNANGTQISPANFDLDLPDFAWESYDGPFTMTPDNSRVIPFTIRH